MNLVAILLLAAIQPPATAEDLIARHIAASGGARALHTIRSLTFYGEGSDRKPMARMIKMRPSYFIVGCIRSGCSFAEGFDGRRAWEMQPQRKRLYTARGEAAKAIRRAGEFDFPFIGYRQKGLSVKFMGTETFNGKPALRLEVRRDDGLEESFYFDAVTYLVIANRRTVPIHARGRHIDQVTTFSDYRPVAGYLYPHRLETRDAASSEVLESGRWTSIAANEIAGASRFLPPPVDPSDATRTAVRLYNDAQRLSAVEILATCRRAGVEGSDLTWLAYQLLKDPNPEKALPLFRELVEQQPRSSDAWDSLGDALDQFGDTSGAIAAFSRAVDLDANAQESRTKLERLKRPW